jgi:hypothetical protein
VKCWGTTMPPKMPGAAWTRGAKAAAKTALEPLLREMAFTGTFPRYRHISRGQVCLVEIGVRVRTGLIVELLSLPPRSKQGTSRSEKLRKTLLAVRSTSDIPALSRKLATASRSFRREALAFWHTAEGHWSRDARAARKDDQQTQAEIGRAMLDGDARKLAAAASRVDATEFAKGVASANFRWNDEVANRHIWKCANVLIEYDPPKDEITASLVVSAVEHLSKKGNVKSRPLAKHVLEWGKPHLRSNNRLATQVSHVARARTYEGKCEIAAALFELVLDGRDSLRHVDSSAVKTACALFCVLSANRRVPAGRTLQMRTLSFATEEFPKDRYVQFNAACVLAELGDTEASADHLLAALTLGIAPRAVMAQRGLKSILSDARVTRALRGVRVTKVTSTSSAGLLPP